MKILAIDTSGLVATVAITDGDLLKAQFSIQHKTTHSEILMPMLKDMTDKIGLDLSTIDAIAVAKGPGSFTGLRIGSATAKGLALALDKPIIPIPTVDGLAYNLYGNEKISEYDFASLYHMGLMYDNTVTLLTCEDERIEGGYASRRIVSAKRIH